MLMKNRNIEIKSFTISLNLCVKLNFMNNVVNIGIKNTLLVLEGIVPTIFFSFFPLKKKKKRSLNLLWT